MTDDDNLTQEQLRNMSLAGLSLEIAAMRREVAEMRAIVTRMDAALLQPQPAFDGTCLLDRLAQADMARQAARLTQRTVVGLGAVAAAVTAILAFLKPWQPPGGH